jgi:hypothetical protein
MMTTRALEPCSICDPSRLGRSSLSLAIKILESRAQWQDPVRISPQFARLVARYLGRLLA